jgi:hypothetical protein
VRASELELTRRNLTARAPVRGDGCPTAGSAERLGNGGEGLLTPTSAQPNEGCCPLIRRPVSFRRSGCPNSDRDAEGPTEALPQGQRHEPPHKR